MPTINRSSKLVRYLHGWAKVTPLVAAIFAPFSILFDIPALSESWFVDSDSNIAVVPTIVITLPDPKGNITLSAVGLLFNVIANALLIVRFSTGASARWWRVATRLSLLSWIFKVVIALINVIIYGRNLRPHSIRWEGLWCAVVSLILCGVVTVLLIFHWIMEPRIGKGQPTDDQLSIRLAGRLFMMNVILFVIDVGLLALLASKVEHWTYFQGIYFTVVTFLTIGYGDFKPEHTVTRILIFMFAVLGIAQLGSIVKMLVGFFDSRAQARRAESRAKFEENRKEQEENRVGLAPDLFQEIQFLDRLGAQQESRLRLKRVTTSLIGLIVFWVIGAAVFSQLEDYPYGTGLYFIYVSFLTIGYGDYAPTTPAGRVIFVLYSLLAVPVMASLAIQAVQQIMYATSERVHDRRKMELGLKPELTVDNTESKTPIAGLDLAVVDDPRKISRKSSWRLADKTVYKSDTRPYNHVVVPHANLAEQWHEGWERQVRLYRAEGFSDRSAIRLANIDLNAAKERDRIIAREFDEKDEETVASSSREHEGSCGVHWQKEKKVDEDALLAEKILEYAISLESRARKLLITHLDEDDGGKSARIVLKADLNVQMREVKAVLREIAQEKEEIGPMETGPDSIDRETYISRSERFESGRMAGIIQRTLRDNPNEPISNMAGKSERETLDAIQKYREDFAGLLAAGSRWMRLKGDERALFERRRVDVSEEF